MGSQRHEPGPSLDTTIGLDETAGRVVRVIAGYLGGRILQSPRGQVTRPTSDRVRESLFMMLGPLTGLRVVDLFAGSGALGIEALSRGANRVDFVEPDRAARTVLESNLASLQLEDLAMIWPLQLPSGLKRVAAVLGEADLILMDPPYGHATARATLEGLGEKGILKGGAVVVVEHHAKDILPQDTGSLALGRGRRYGETCLSFYRVTEPSSGP